MIVHPSVSDTTPCEEDDSTTEITLHAELDDYLEAPCVPIKTNPFVKIITKHIYPHLSIVAKDVL